MCEVIHNFHTRRGKEVKLLNKKLLVAITMAIFALFLVVGCGGGQSADTQQPEQPAAEQPAEEPAAEEPATEEPKQEQASAGGEMVFVSSAEKATCADCHGSLADATAKIENHPQMPVETLANCQPCHADGDLSLRKVLHTAHLGGAVSVSCVHCHKLVEDGTLPVGELAPQGAKFVTIEVASVDKAPGGCTDCHKKHSDDRDYSLTATIAKIEGHPQLPIENASGCVQCHAEGSPLALSLAMHKAHLQGEHYKENYGNSCLNCHDAQNKMAVKGL